MKLPLDEEQAARSRQPYTFQALSPDTAYPYSWSQCSISLSTALGYPIDIQLLSLS